MKFRLICLCLLLCLGLSACNVVSPPASDGQDTGNDAISTAPVETETETETETEPDDGRTVVKIVCSIEDAVIFSGGETVQDVTETAFVPVSFELKYGYVYNGYEVDGVLYPGKTITLDQITKDTTVTLKLDYATYELPIVRLDTDDAPISAKDAYVDMTFDLINTDQELTRASGGVRLRGQSTATFAKKPYRIKFDQKQSLFGLTSAKSWVLLAEYLDPSCMHNYTAFYLGATSDALGFTPTAHHVNLYLNGEYMGIYTLCEQVQENEGRIGIEQTITPDMADLSDFNFYVCMDEYAPEEPDAVMGETYFYVASCGRYFSLKYPEKADFCSDEQFYSFFSQLERRYNKIMDACLAGNAKKMKAYLDTDSLIDHMIIDQIMGERDHVWKSFYTYQIAGEKIAFGPIWDYDYSLYVPWTAQPNEYYTVDSKIEYSNVFFQGVARSDELYGKLCDRYQSHYSDVLTDCITHVQGYKTTIRQSLALNEARWYKDKQDITDQNYRFLVDFLKNRKKVLDRAWK